MDEAGQIYMYEYMSELAQTLDYRAFTPLQDAAFRHPDLYDENKDIFIIGQTSAGKTLIPLLLFYQRVLRADELRQPRPRMLFVVPYRALAAQKKRELQEFFRRLDVPRNTGSTTTRSGTAMRKSPSSSMKRSISTRPRRMTSSGGTTTWSWTR